MAVTAWVLCAGPNDRTVGAAQGSTEALKAFLFKSIPQDYDTLEKFFLS